MALGEVTRRNFLEISGAALGSVGLNGGISPDLDASSSAPEDFQHHAVLIGPGQARPPAGGEYLSQWDTYQFVYFASDTGAKYEIDSNTREWSELAMPNPTTQVDELKVSERKSFFNHTFARPNAPDDTNWDYVAADITKQNSEVELASTTELVSQQRGNYQPGSEATPGVAMRVTGTPTAGECFGGYITASDGMAAGEDSTDSFLILRGSGNEVKVYRNNWNGYIPSKRLLVKDRPIIVRFPHLFYGGGTINVRAYIAENGEYKLRKLHTFRPNDVDAIPNGPPIQQPNLPIKFKSDGLTGASLRANASHYEFADENQENRVNGEQFVNVDASETGWTPLLLWRKKPNWEMVNVQPLALNVFASNNDAKIELQLNPSLSSVTTDPPTHTDPDETAVDILSATVDSNGQRRWPSYVAAGKGQAASGIDAENLDFNLPSQQPVGLFAQGVGGISTLKGSVAWKEFF